MNIIHILHLYNALSSSVSNITNLFHENVFMNGCIFIKGCRVGNTDSSQLGFGNKWKPNQLFGESITFVYISSAVCLQKAIKVRLTSDPIHGQQQ